MRPANNIGCLIITLLVFLCVAIAFAVPTFAQNLPWCAIMDNDGSTQCNFYTQQQCRQTLSGIGGECIRNPAGSTPQQAPPQSENAQGLLPLQLESPGPPPGLGPPNN